MIVTLDGQKLDGTFPTDSTLRGLIDRVRESHLDNRLVVSVAIDGRDLLDDELSAALGRSLQAAQQVDLESSAPKPLVVQALRELVSRLDEAAPEHRRCAERLNAGEISTALTDFGKVLSAWQSCHETVTHAAGLLSEDLNDATTSGAKLADSLARLAEKLRDVRDAFEARDFVLLADLVQFELGELCGEWSAMLAKVADALHDPTDAELQERVAPPAETPELSETPELAETPEHAETSAE